jgi:alanyl-tRNA synthetase
VAKAIASLLESNAALQKSVAAYQQKEVSGLKNSLVTEIVAGNLDSLIKRVQVPTSDSLKNLALELQENQSNLFCLLAAEIEGKACLAISISKETVESKGLDAAKIIRELAKEVQGGGGGQAFLATAGGQNPAGIPKVLELAKAYLV